jgi:quercetin dioxygenase-like cupin family protein
VNARCLVTALSSRLRLPAGHDDEETLMTTIQTKTFEHPDETLPFVDHGRIELLKLGGREVGRAVFEPGWRWSEHVKPIAGTETCEYPHLGYVVSGHMRVLMTDGSKAELRSGDAFFIPPGHDAEVVGAEDCVMLDFAEDDADYARPE